jgi:hypothetical protein
VVRHNKIEGPVTFAVKNHYNPCFWTAHWNAQYFAQQVLGKATSNLRAREQRVHALNVESAKVYETAVENLHFDKNLGEAEMTPDDLRDFCKRHHPDQYDEFCRDMENRPETLYLNFEDILTGIENGPAYKALLTAIKL